jgi:hypothetical protein
MALPPAQALGVLAFARFCRHQTDTAGRDGSGVPMKQRRTHLTLITPESPPARHHHPLRLNQRTRHPCLSLLIAAYPPSKFFP